MIKSYLWWVILIAFSGLVTCWAWANVEVGWHRRPLQNIIYRGYQVLRWLTSCWRGVDAGVLEYYCSKDNIAITPLNEEQYPPIKGESDSGIPRIGL